MTEREKGIASRSKTKGKGQKALSKAGQTRGGRDQWACKRGKGPGPGQHQVQVALNIGAGGSHPQATKYWEKEGEQREEV